MLSNAYTIKRRFICGHLLDCQKYKVGGTHTHRTCENQSFFYFRHDFCGAEGGQSTQLGEKRHKGACHPWLYLQPKPLGKGRNDSQVVFQRKNHFSMDTAFQTKSMILHKGSPWAKSILDTYIKIEL